MASCSIKILDLKKLSHLLIDSIDLTDFTYINLKIKIEHFCEDSKLPSFDALIKLIRTDPITKESFLRFMLFDTFELFRDPSLWRFVKDELLKNIKNKSTYRVLFPSCYQASELVSFLILRDELNLTNNIQVIYTNPLDMFSAVQSSSVCYRKRNYELNLSNYKRIDGKDLSEAYFKIENKSFKPMSFLFENTKYYNYNEQKDVFSKKSDIIFYRNKLLNINPPLQKILTQNLISSLKTGGFFIIGIKEKLKADATEGLSMFNDKENIYKRNHESI